MNPGGSPPDKPALRRSALARRGALAPAARAKASRRIHTAVRALPAFRQARVVHCYLSMPGEVSTGALFEICQALGKKTFAPFQDPSQGQLGWAPWRSGDPVVNGPMNVPEPAPALRTPAPPEAFDLVLVPGLAFDAMGTRLGFGKGYYDQFLARLKREHHSAGESATRPPVFVGLAFAVQLVECLPKDSWDVAMDAVVTEGGALLVPP